ncbi:hypothetical protein EDF60_1596 [Leucobacter luti]|uniref:hypothetical protein n=1 Tax=Leucobacter luti TaxID=340320 RepID=UPI00104C7052|nr:hypothetical protein [Leucobacter luti]MCW2286950.1 hypothetical protein [Leucobacter luti]TCK41177.1 hypothetical protein EDF60_1596 [Leucobacter luti]
MLFIVCAVLVGCATPDNAPVPDDISPQQAAALSDLIVTREEYEDGFYRYKACMEKLGYPLAEISENDSVFKFLIPIDAASKGGDTCYVREFQSVDSTWQTQDEFVERSEEAKLLRECLEELGIPGGQTQDGRLALLQENGYSPMDCLELVG